MADTKQLGLKKLLEDGNVEKFLEISELQERTKARQEFNDLIKPFSMLGDVIAKHAKGVFVDEVLADVKKIASGVENALSEALKEETKSLRSDLEAVVTKNNDAARRDALAEIERKVTEAEARVTKIMTDKAVSEINRLLPKVAADAKLSEEEIEEITTNAALSVESQMDGLIAAHLSEINIPVEQVSGLKAYIQSQIPEVDFSKASIDWRQIKNTPNLSGGGAGARTMRWLNDVTNASTAADGQVLTANGDGTFTFETANSLPDQTGNNGKYLTTDGTDASWATLAGGGDMAAATYDPNTVSGDAFLMTNMNGGNHKMFYTNGTGDVTELTHGSSGTYLMSNGATSAPSWETVTATVNNLSDVGDVTITTIASGEILKWNGAAWINNTLAEAGIAAASHSHATTDITSGTFADARIAQSNVTQHQAALSITESQISDYDPASTDMARVAGSTYSTIQHMQDIFHSAGVSSGGTITDDTDGTISVSAGTGFIRATDNPVAQVLFTDWAAENGANVALTDNDMNYVYVEYNAGSPRAIATTTERTDLNTNLFLGSVYRSGTTLHITQNTRAQVGDHALQMIERMKATMPFQRESGGILGESGTRNITVTAGAFWEGLSRFTTSSFDSSVADTFTYHYRNGGGGWTEVASQTAIDNTQYDNGTGTLATLTANRYGVHWVYLEQDDEIHVVYGLGDYTLADAEGADAPASVPPQFAESHTRLIGKIIIQKSASSFTSVLSAFDTVLNAAAANDHGDLLGLTDDDHTQYLLVDGTRSMTGSLDLAASTDLSFNGAAILSDSAGTMTLSNIDAVDATTDATLTALVDTAAVTAAGALMDSELTDIAAVKALSDADVSTTNTGTSTTAFVTPDGLAGSYAGKKSVGVMLVAPGTDVATGTSKAFFTIPEDYNGMNLISVHAEHTTAGTTGVTTYDINKNGTSMLSTKLTVDSAETGSDTAATAAVIDGTQDDVSTNDVITIDVDGVSTTAPQGAFIRMTFQLP